MRILSVVYQQNATFRNIAVYAQLKEPEYIVLWRNETSILGLQRAKTASNGLET